MGIDAISSNDSLFSATRSEPPQSATDRVQSVFSEILKQAGRPGYAAADEVAATENSEDGSVNLEKAARDSLAEWFRTDGSHRYRPGSFNTDVDTSQLKQRYGEIVSRSYHEGGYHDPKTFLGSLSKEELAIVQHVQRLADPIQVDSLTEEGALNLLIPPPAQIDLNFDGFTQSGAAYGFRFPDSRTPPEVALAWEKATANLPASEKMMYELQMKLPVMTANLIVDDQGAFVRTREPGDADFVNPLADPNYSYTTAAQQMLEYLETFRYQMPQSQFETQHDFWTEFQRALRENGES
jgi:hypothetical protein